MWIGWSMDQEKLVKGAENSAFDCEQGGPSVRSTRQGERQSPRTFCSVARLTSRFRVGTTPPPTYPLGLRPAAPSSCSDTRSHSRKHSDVVAKTSLCSPPAPTPPPLAPRLLLSFAGANCTALGGYSSGALATARNALPPETRCLVVRDLYAVSESESDASSRSRYAGSSEATVKLLLRPAPPSAPFAEVEEEDGAEVRVSLYEPTARRRDEGDELDRGETERAKVGQSEW